jgi:putative membrane protein
MNKSFRLVILSVLVGGVMFGITACHRHEKVQAAREPVLSQSDRNFITQAEDDNVQGRALGQFVKETSRNKDVKNYADTLVIDHSDALQKLGEIMQKYGIKQPTTAPEERSEAAAPLKGLSRRAVDRKFVDLMVQDHEKAIVIFQQEASSAEDGYVRHCAINLLPTLDYHLKKAQELQPRMAQLGRK